MEEKPAEKARLLKEFEAARDKFLALSKKRSDEQARIDDEKLSKLSNDNLKFSPAEISEAELKELRQELKSYRAGKTLAEAVDGVYIPFELALVEPLDDDAKTEPARFDDEKQVRQWKIFSPEGGFSAELPDNAGFSSSADSRIYTASGNGLSFFIIETASSRDLAENEQDAALNVLAWVLTKYVGNRYVADGRWNDRFESELTRKDKLGDRPARFYTYHMMSCKENKEGIMLFVIGRKKNYSINVRGAGESDERVQRFLKSLKLN